MVPCLNGKDISTHLMIVKIDGDVIQDMKILVTTEDALHNVVPHVGAVAGTDEIKAKVTACGNLILLFALGSRSFKATITRCYVMITNRHHTLGLDPFRRTGCQKVVHNMHNKVKITLDSGEIIDIPISVVLNHLNYAKIKIISPGSLTSQSESSKIEQMVCVATHSVRMNEVALNNTLTVHKKGFHSSFQSDFLLS